jgi:hypothetical protein
MKIKTIWDTRPDRFDESVNKHLEEGMTLARREVIPDTKDLDRSVFYAELVKLDPPAEPETTDPFDAVRAIKATCEGVSLEDCHACRCPLSAWCRKMPDGYDPTDWDIPGEVRA